MVKVNDKLTSEVFPYYHTKDHLVSRRAITNSTVAIAELKQSVLENLKSR